jgi:hypothetical protein
VPVAGYVVAEENGKRTTSGMDGAAPSPYAASVDRFVNQIKGASRKRPPASAKASTAAHRRGSMASPAPDSAARLLQSPFTRGYSPPAAKSKNTKPLAASAAPGKAAAKSPPAGAGRRDRDDAKVWRDVRKGRGELDVRQLMCECCGYWINVHTPQDPHQEDGEDLLDHVQVRFENRCPIMIFSQMDGVGAGRVTRHEAFGFLESRGWDASNIMAVLSRLDLQDTGAVDQDELVLWHDATVASDGVLRDIESAAAIITTHTKCLMQFEGSIVQSKGDSSF